MINARSTIPTGAAGRTVYGPVISAIFLFDVSSAEQTGTSDPVIIAALRTQDCHEIWLASCDDQLSSFQGTLEIHSRDVGSAPKGSDCIARTDAYCVKLYLDTNELSEVRANLLSSARGIGLKLEFDVEYLEGYESPGGYSAEYGIRYWDDLGFPIVPIHRYRFGQVTTS